MKLSFILACVASFFVAFATAEDPKEQVTVYTPLGNIVGYVGEQGNVFRGIPYAEPTDGANRFAPPVARGKFEFPYEAFEDGAGCPQDCVLPPHMCPETISEACLFLSVFSPKGTTPSQSLPVMVYFHGGNFKQGTAGGPLYNGTTISSRGNVILVAVNYRLGSLGFLAMPELGINGNFGILDQQLALRWVQSYIGNFGGDGSRITIFGQSAGAGSVATHLISPYTKGLFANALLLSNPFAIPFRNKVSMAAIAKIFRKEAGCADAADAAACLRSKTWKELIDAQVRTEANTKHTADSFLHAFLPWTPMVDGDVVPAQPLHAFEAGLARPVPTIIGTVADEAVPFIYEAAKQPVDKIKYAAFIGVIFGLGRMERILKQYPAISNTDNREQLVAAGNDFIFQCSGRNASDTLALWQRQDVWSYVYDHVLSFGPDAWGPKYTHCYDRVCHAAELPILFFSTQWLYAYTPEENKLAEAFIQYVTNFAHTGNPNKGPAAAVADAPSSIFGAGVSAALSAAIAPLVGAVPASAQAAVPVEWTQYDDASRSILYLTTEKVAENIPMWHDDKCSWWDAMGYVWVD